MKIIGGKAAPHFLGQRLGDGGGSGR